VTSISPDPKSGAPRAEGNARLLDGVTGTEHWVAAIVDPDGLRLLPADPEAPPPQCPLLWPWEETFRPASAGNRVFTTIAARDARLSVLDSRLAGTIRSRVRGDERSSGRSAGLFRRRPGPALVLTATALAAIVVVLALAPVSAGIARLLPADTGAAISDDLIDTLGRTHGRCLAKAGGDAIADLAQRLARPAGVPPPVVAVIDWDLLNAFALPGGRIILTRRLITAAEDPSEIAAVLAHEIAHVAHRDPTTGWIRSEGIGLLMTAVFGASSVGGLVESLAGSLLDAQFTREQEEQADIAALSYLRSTGIRADGGAAFFERLSRYEPDGALGDILSVASTHPGSRERAARFARAATGSEPGLDPREYEAVRQICTVTRKH